MSKSNSNGWSVTGRAGGPKTDAGKMRSSRNSLKHGLFSRVVVLDDEPRKEYEKLWADLRRDLQPHGALEEIEVEQLTALSWRKRRLLLAENGEITRRTCHLDWWDQLERQREEAEAFAGGMVPFANPGLITKIGNPNVLETCIALLSGLKAGLQKDGFDANVDRAILEKIYGDLWRIHLLHTPYELYSACLKVSGEQQHAERDHASDQRDLANFVKVIDDEIQRLENYKNGRTVIETLRRQIEVARHSIPNAKALDRLTRYEVHIERLFDRTLAQLERLQRMRLGQPVLPQLKVDLSS